MKLDEIESYLVKRLKDGGHIHNHSCLHHDITNIFAEIRAREQAKNEAEAKEAVEANEELIADMEAEEACRQLEENE